ncbi:MAG: hypothetical protein ACYCT1_20010 [Steroidobacteraceae bacterium]
MTEPIHGRCLICFEDKPFDAFRTNCGAPPNDVVGVCRDCTAAAVAARNARRAQADAGTDENDDSDEGYDDSTDTGIIHCPRCQHPNDANETACILCAYPLPGGACSRD